MSDNGEGFMDDRMEQLLSGQYFKKYQEVMYSEITEKFNMTIMEVRVLLFLIIMEAATRRRIL